MTEPPLPTETRLSCQYGENVWAAIRVRGPSSKSSDGPGTVPYRQCLESQGGSRMTFSIGRMAGFALAALTGLALAFGLAVPRAEAQSIDPQSLVGEWRGQEVRTARAQSNAYYLTIVKVEGDQVSLRIERSGHTFNSVGTLKGNTLNYGGG